MKIVVCTNDKHEYVRYENFPFITDRHIICNLNDLDVNMVTEDTILIIDAKNFDKISIEKNLDKLSFFKKNYLIIVRPQKYNIYSEYVSISPNVIIAEDDKALEDVINDFEENEHGYNLIRFGKWSLNIVDGTLKFNNEVVDILQEKNRMILQELALNKNEVVTRKSIMDILWVDMSHRNKRSFDVFMNAIKKDLSADSSVYIDNVYGVGYRLNVIENYYD